MAQKTAETAAAEACVAQKTAEAAAAEARMVREAAARAEYQAKLVRLIETLHLDDAPLALRLVLPLARGMRFLSNLPPLAPGWRFLYNLLRRDPPPPPGSSNGASTGAPGLAGPPPLDATLAESPNRGSTGTPGLAGPPPLDAAKDAKTNIQLRVLGDAELSLRLLGTPYSRRGKD
jgi:hypothetical protein